VTARGSPSGIAEVVVGPYTDKQSNKGTHCNYHAAIPNLSNHRKKDEKGKTSDNEYIISWD
jgi:hypothetical protein